MTNGTTAAMNRGAGSLAEQKSAVRVIDSAMSRWHAQLKRVEQARAEAWTWS
jgi:hypothetical protein